MNIMRYLCAWERNTADVPRPKCDACPLAAMLPQSGVCLPI